MAIIRAWSSEDNNTIAYLIRLAGEQHILVNDNGECQELRGQGIDLDKKFIKLCDKLDAQHRSLLEIPLHKEGDILYVRAEAPNRNGRVFRVRAKDVLLNCGANPHGIDQLVLVTHTVEFAGKHPIEERDIEEQSPMLLRNSSQLIGLVQGWVMTADVSKTL